MNPTDNRSQPPRRPGRRRLGRTAGTLLLATLVLAVGVAGFPHAANAAELRPVVLAADSIVAVVNNIRGWLVGILVAVATLFLTVGGLRIVAANGDPGENEKGKLALKSAAAGYALALLAPLLVKIVGDWVK